MVQIAGEIGEPPDAGPRHLGPRRAARHRALRATRLVIGALTTYTELRRSPVVAEFLPALAEAAATIGAAQIQNRGTIGGNVDQRVARRRHAASAPRARRRDGARQRRPASGRGRRRTSGPPTAPPRGATTSCCCGSGIPLVAEPTGPVPQGRDATGAGDQQGRHGAGLARGRRRRRAWTDVRLALGSVAATTVRAPTTEAVLDGCATHARDRRTRRSPRCPPSSARSTTSDRPPTTAASWPAASCIGSSATKADGEVSARASRRNGHPRLHRHRGLDPPARAPRRRATPR